jgi:hypothetical protein
MRPVVTFALACAGLAAAQATLAETLRCGSVLIQPGDDAWYVLEKCGEPSAWTAVVVPAMVSGAVYHVGLTRADRWLYHRNFGQFPAVLTIGDDWRVVNIEFPRVRD